MEATPDFASLLDDLFGKADVADSAAGRAAPALDYLAVAEELHSGRILVAEAIAAAEYREAAEPVPDFSFPSPDEAEPLPVEPPSLDPAAIAAELDLPHRDASGLARLRRDFAFRNHPDRVPSALRARAMQRMQIANAMIDDALRGLARG